MDAYRTDPTVTLANFVEDLLMTRSTLSPENLFRIILLGLILASCSQPSKVIRVVDNQSYQRPSCWVTKGQWESFVVFSTYGDEGIPYFVSAKCITKGKFDTYGAGTLAQLGHVKVSDAERMRGPALGYESIGDNLRSDLPGPKASDRVYFFVGNLEPANVGQIKAYKVVSTSVMRDTGSLFGDLLAAGPPERAQILDRSK